MKSMLAMIPPSLVQAFQVIGGIMPALGISMLVSFLGKKHLMPFFFLGFFLVAFLHLSIMGIAVFAIIAAIILNSGQSLSITKS